VSTARDSTKVRRFLRFQRNAAEAMGFFVSLFPDGEITDVVSHGPNVAGTEGSIARASFVRRFALINDRYGVSRQLNLQ
jgi:predicted 3-demethylubiquinone-9 3-methyltransferase (glyoxalase superfamily)